MLFSFTVYLSSKHSDRTEVVDLLLKAGASKDLKNRWGQTALEIAIELGNIYFY